MNVFVHSPYEDELVYSVCVRYLSEFPMVGRDKLIREIFGAGLCLSAHLPRNLHDFSERTGKSISMTKEEIFWRHSMYPFLCAYLPEKRRAEVMDYAYFGYEHKRLPLLLRAVLPPKFLRWCPDCVAEDRARPECGEAYWRRAHQILGVWQCERHGCDLIDSAIPRAFSDPLCRAADIVIPENVHGFRGKRRCSSMEAMLRTRLVALLNSAEFAHRPKHPNFKDAAARAGFQSSGKVDYPRLYEEFSGYWGDVLDRLHTQHSIRIKGMGWLHALFNSKQAVCAPLVREMINIFFQDRFGIDVNGLPPMERTGRRPVFYCPNPYAEHGPGTSVKRLVACKDKPGVIAMTCECGFCALVRETDAGKAITMDNLIKVTRYGPSWIKECLKLRADGKDLAEAAAALGVKYRRAFHWCHQGKTRYSPISLEQRDGYRAEWTAILDKIAPGPPRLATSEYHSLYSRLLREDREWFQETMKTYRRKYNHSLKRINWPARDEEYTEAVVAAAARLQRMEGMECLTVMALLKEAAIHTAVVSRSVQHLPGTVAILTRLTGKPWRVFQPYLEGGKSEGLSM